MFHPVRFSWCALSVIVMLAQAALAATPSPEDGFNPGIWNGPPCIQADGKILTRNDQSKFVRINPDGSCDSSFQSAAFGSIIRAAVQPDGKVIIAGYSISLGTGSLVYLARLNPDGSIDTGFTPLYESNTDGIHTVRRCK